MRKLLVGNAECNDCEELTMPCYDQLLEDYFGYERYECGYKYTVQEIADMHPDEIVLMRIDGHLTCAVYSQVVDIFDCTNELVDTYWLVNRA